jgi:MFS family permease
VPDAPCLFIELPQGPEVTVHSVVGPPGALPRAERLWQTRPGVSLHGGILARLPENTAPQDSRPHDGRRGAAGVLPRAVIGLGLVSLFTDLSSEAIFPLLPAFLVGLGSSSAFIGAVEGSAEFVASILKYVTGVTADRRTRRKPFVIGGYGLSTVARPLVAFALAPWHVLVIRVLDRVGKGVRTSPRDAWIASAVPASMRARAYGFHRAMDHAGAALGTLVSAGLLWYLARPGKPVDLDAMRTVFLWAALPGVAALAALVLTKEDTGASTARAAASTPPPRSDLVRVLVPVLVFACANATDAFLIVRATKLGAPVMIAPLLWLCLHVVKAATGTFGGRLADRHGRRNALFTGWLVYAVTWSSVGFVNSVPLLFLATAVYGTSHGLVEGAEKALVAESVLGGKSGTAFGVYNMGVGLAALGSSLAFGAAWDRWGGAVPFLGTGALALLAALLLIWLVPNQKALNTEAPPPDRRP